jgi:hypothetical protein
MVNGKILAACEQERYDGIKHSRNFLTIAIQDRLFSSRKFFSK